jgi:AcrR family transcriptional regulator
VATELSQPGTTPAGPGPEPPALDSTRRQLTLRQAEAVQQLVEAAAAQVEVSGYAGLTVRNVARQAGVATATAYTYFSSKEHLLAEVLWRRIHSLPPTELDSNSPPWSRLAKTVQEMGQFTTDSPALVAACTPALVSESPDVKHLRDRIGAEIHRRMVAAVGDQVEADLVQVLEITYFGALLAAGMGHTDFGDVPEFMGRAARLMAPGAPSGNGAAKRTKR